MKPSLSPVFQVEFFSLQRAAHALPPYVFIYWDDENEHAKFFAITQHEPSAAYGVATSSFEEPTDAAMGIHQDRPQSVIWQD